MAFTVHTLTTTGASMIASATVGNKLIIAGCALSTNQYTEAAAQQLLNIPNDSPWTTRITASSSANRVEARATFLREDGAVTGGNWYSMILFGRMASDSESTKNPIAVIVSDTQFYIPDVDSSISDVSVIFSLGFNLDINTVEVPVETIYALNSAFETLKGIAVTTHNFNDPSLGDSQYIKGDKYFEKSIGSDNGLKTSDFTINGNDINIISSQMNEGGSGFEYIIAESHDSTNGIWTGLYLERDNTDDYTLKSNAEHVYLPGLVSDRTDFYYIGCITLIAIYPPSSPNPNHLDVGSTIMHQSGVLVVNPAKYDPSTNKFVRDADSDLTDMKFRLMSSCDLAQYGTSICLAMRVE